MEQMILKDGTQVEIQNGATLNSIIVLLDDYASLETLAGYLSDDNLSEVQFVVDGKTKGAYTKMALKTPNFYITKLGTGKIQVVFGLRAKTHEELNKDAVAVAISYLSDEQALAVPSLFEEWSPNKKIKAGTRYRRDGILYKCLQDHIGQADWAPEVSPSLFAKVLTSDDGTVLDWVQPDSTNPYSKGNKVKHNGKIWISDLDINTWEPGVYGWSVAE